MRVAFVCDTPYQTLNVLNLYTFLYHGKPDIYADCYIINQFAQAETISAKIQELGLFDHVYLLRHEANRLDLPRGLKRCLRVAYSYLNPVYAIKNQFDGPVEEMKYDIIYASLITCFISALLKRNPDAEFRLFDDGIGSYAGDLIANGGGSLYKLFSKLTGTGAKAARASKLYVYNLKMCESTAADEICQMPDFTDAFLNIMRQVYGTPPDDVYKENGIIFITHPSDGLAYVDEVFDQLHECLLPYKNRVTVRRHPREAKDNRYDAFAVDSYNAIWEAQIAQMDMDRVALVSCYSTAQMNPNFLYGKEPWVLFGYGLTSNIDDQIRRDSDAIVEKLRNAYTHKERIMMPRTREELLENLETIANALQ